MWKVVLNWTWCLPQTIIGLFWFLITKVKGQQYKSKMFNSAYHTEYKYRRDGVSLGYFTFGKKDSLFIKTHEYGHHIQSLMLGPLYLLIIGIPSIIWLFLYRTTALKRKYSYYDFYTEKWAEKIADKHRYEVLGSKLFVKGER
jgi:hypothetical protein